MTAYTGTRSIIQGGDSIGGMYPLVNPMQYSALPKAVKRTNRVVYGIKIDGTSAAIATDSYTYTITTVGDAMYVENAYYIDPVGLSVDTSNYNTMIVDDGTLTLCSSTTAYGVTPNEVQEITKANTEANRLLAAGDTLRLVITGTSAGRVINPMFVFVVCYLA